jgi:hypothetical protein
MRRQLLTLGVIAAALVAVGASADADRWGRFYAGQDYTGPFAYRPNFYGYNIQYDGPGYAGYTGSLPYGTAYGGYYGGPGYNGMSRPYPGYTTYGYRYGYPYYGFGYLGTAGMGEPAFTHYR